MRDLEDLVKVSIDCGFNIHRTFGPGLFESVYEAVLADKLQRSGLAIEVQKPIDIVYEGRILREGFRIDILVEQQLIIEIKSVETLLALHKKQLLTYLRLMNQPLGLVMNFGGEIFRDNCKRVANNYAAAKSNQTQA